MRAHVEKNKNGAVLSFATTYDTFLVNCVALEVNASEPQYGLPDNISVDNFLSHGNVVKVTDGEPEAAKSSIANNQAENEDAGSTEYLNNEAASKRPFDDERFPFLRSRSSSSGDIVDANTMAWHNMGSNGSKSSEIALNTEIFQRKGSIVAKEFTNVDSSKMKMIDKSNNNVEQLKFSSKALESLFSKSVNNAYPISFTEKGFCIFRSAYDAVSINNLRCVKKCFAFHNGVRMFRYCGMSFIRIGYGICIKYIDTCGSRKTTVKDNGYVLFFNVSPTPFDNFNVNIRSLPYGQICKSNIKIKTIVKITLGSS